jgi:hypothetical protein
MVTSPTSVTVVKQWVQLWDLLLHKYVFNFHITLVWLPQLPDLALDSPRLMVQVLHPPQKFEPPLFQMVEAIGLKIMVSRSRSTA